MKTLIIYNLIPDNLLFFIVPDEDITPYWEKMLIEANGKTINVHDMNDGMKWIMSATCPQKEYCDPEVDEQYHCCLDKYKVLPFENDRMDVLTGPFSKVYVSEFYL